MSTTQAPRYPTLLEYAWHWERTAPDRVWFTQPLGGGQVRELTYRQVFDEVRRMAAHLRSLGLPPQSNIALWGRNSAHWIIADLAIWVAGHVSVPIYPTLNAASVRQILEHSEARLMFVGKLDTWHTAKEGVPGSVTTIRLPLSPELGGASWDELIAKTPPLTGCPTRGGDEVATIIYTSGSTGVPKGVMMTFGSMLRAVDCSVENSARMGLVFGPGDRGLSYLPLAHAYERAVVEVGGLVLGGQIYFTESVATFFTDLKRARPTWFVSVPRLWQQFYLGVTAKVPPANLDRLLAIPLVSWLVRRKILKELGFEHVRLACSGSAPIAPELIAWYRRLGLELIEGYGMTEDFCCSHASLPGKSRPGYVGFPVPGVECRLSEEREILIKSPGALKGYYKNPEATRAAFTEDGFFRTGDLGEHDADGNLRVTGRVKELFKTSKGKYVAPVPIENLLLQHPRIEAACVSGVGQPQPYALVMLSPAARAEAAAAPAALEPELAALLDKVNGLVDRHEALAFVAVVPDEWTIENGLLTPTMKLKRSQIETRYAGQIEAWYAARSRVVWHRAS